MKKFDEFVNRIDFKKVTRYYIVVSIILLITAFLGSAYVFRDKISVAMNYMSLSHALEKKGADQNIIKKKISKLASDSNDIIDVMLLDKDNNIVFKAKNSSLGANGKFELALNPKHEKFMQDSSNPEIFYKIVEPFGLVLDKDSVEKPKKIKKEYTDEFFYYNNFNTKKVYMLNYLLDEDSGMKIFIISHAKPIPYAERTLEAVGILLTLIFIVYWVMLALWVYRDSNRKNLNAPLWGILILITNLVGFIVYLIYKQNNQTCYKCGALQSKFNIFCSKCGTKINDTCSGCGATINKRDNYCSRCGNKLESKELD